MRTQEGAEEHRTHGTTDLLPKSVPGLGAGSAQVFGKRAVTFLVLDLVLGSKRRKRTSRQYRETPALH